MDEEHRLAKVQEWLKSGQARYVGDVSVEERDAIVGCAPADVTNPASRRFSCQECSAEVWLAPSSLRVWARFPAMKLLCMECAVRLAKEAKEI